MLFVVTDKITVFNVGSFLMEATLNTPKSMQSMLYGAEVCFLPRGCLQAAGDLLHTIPSKTVIPTPLRIGFLGLGIMGQGMVMNVLRSGHEVTVWNRTIAKVSSSFC